jgi:p21-activated kinase 2
VFKVKRKTDGLICALKFVEPKNDNEREIIINEVGVMRMCEQNQGILKVIEAYDFKSRLWIFVELMDDALTSYVQTLNKTYSENVVKYVLKKTLEGLNFLHVRHIIHRDIKSDNLLMNTKGEVKLADFGYAVQLTEEKAGRKSKVGTVCWMAPELIRGERLYTQKVDIWSFGIFAMEMADGDPPYISEPQGRVIFNIVKKDPPPINQRWSADFKDFVK